jgi:hypothetical protein
VPAGFYVNVHATLVETDRSARLESLDVGRLSIPPWLVEQGLPPLVSLWRNLDLQAVHNSLKSVSISPKAIDVTYEWHAGLADELRAVLVPSEDRERLRIHHERLVAVSRSVTAKNVSLIELLTPLFRLAAERSNGRPVMEHRAALFILMLYVNGRSLEMVVPEAKDWPRPTEHDVLLNKRDDLAKHFIVSAALAGNAGSPLADAVGLYKEIDDSRGGTGFSFNDIAADRAGTRFGEYASSDRSALGLQRRILGGVREQDFMPATADLPEFMPEAEFKRRFGGVDAPAYKRLMADIERRVASLPLYR